VYHHRLRLNIEWVLAIGKLWNAAGRNYSVQLDSKDCWSSRWRATCFWNSLWDRYSIGSTKTCSQSPCRDFTTAQSFAKTPSLISIELKSFSQERPLSSGLSICYGKPQGFSPGARDNDKKAESHES
jgi:hypothetical protein